MEYLGNGIDYCFINLIKGKNEIEYIEFKKYNKAILRRIGSVEIRLKGINGIEMIDFMSIKENQVFDISQYSFIKIKYDSLEVDTEISMIFLE